MRDSKALKTAILPTYIIAHQNFALRLCKWLNDMLNRSSGFRRLFSEMSFKETIAIDGDDDSDKILLIEALLVKSGYVWKEVRHAWLGLLTEGPMKEYEMKLEVAKLYVKNYKTIMFDFIGDDQESDVSITNLTVQLFTVPSIAHILMEKMDAFNVMISFFKQVFTDEVDFSGKIFCLKP